MSKQKTTSKDPQSDPAAQVTEALVLAFLDLIHERKMAGKDALVATYPTIATWLAGRTSLPVRERHVQLLAQTMQEAGLITIGGYGIGQPNTYDSREKEMGPDRFWNQVDALLLAWRHPSWRALLQEDSTKDQGVGERNA